MPANTREPGFYWVRTLDGWTIGEWIKARSPDGRCNKWRLPGYSFHDRDEVFQEIDERRIERVKRRTWRNDRAPQPRS